MMPPFTPETSVRLRIGAISVSAASPLAARRFADALPAALAAGIAAGLAGQRHHPSGDRLIDHAVDQVMQAVLGRVEARR